MLAAAILLAALPGCGAGEEGGAPAETSEPGAPLPARLELVADLDFLTSLAVRPGSDALYLTQQTGEVRVLTPDGAGGFTVAAEPLVDRTEGGADPTSMYEAGLLGVAFAPDGERLYLTEAVPTPDPGDHERAVVWRLLEYVLDGDEVAAGSARTLIELVKPRPVHNGGQLRFGPDGYLYTGIGDSWASGDELATGQDPTDLLASLLRIDPTPGDGGAPYRIPPDNPFASGVEGAPEVWLYGVRNPWRFTWDAASGDLWITDVGADRAEEVNLLEAGSDMGANLGWSQMAGSEPVEGGTEPADHRPPLYTYEHDDGRCAVVGGTVLEEGALPGLDGAFIFGDFCAKTVWALERSSAGPRVETIARSERVITSIDPGPDGEPYVLTQRGLYRLIPNTSFQTTTVVN